MNKQLEDCQRLSQTYNNRERLLGVSVTNVGTISWDKDPLARLLTMKFVHVLQYAHLRNLVKNFQPFKDLWITTSDWLCWHESWLSDPLSAINPEQLEHRVTESLSIMHKSVKHFKDLPGE